MKLSELLFTGMDVPSEAQKLMDQCPSCTDGMTDSELKAYEMGVKNALWAAKTVLELDEYVVFHDPELSVMTEFDLDDLIELVEEKEECRYK